MFSTGTRWDGIKRINKRCLESSVFQTCSIAGKRKVHLRNQMEGENVKEFLVSLKRFPTAGYKHLQEPTRNHSDFGKKDPKHWENMRLTTVYIEGEPSEGSVDRWKFLVLSSMKKKALWLNNAPLPNWHMQEERAARQSKLTTWSPWQMFSTDHWIQRSH